MGPGNVTGDTGCHRDAGCRDDNAPPVRLAGHPAMNTYEIKGRAMG